MADVAANTDEKKTGNNAIDAENAASINDQNSAKLVKADTDNVDEAYAAVQGHGDVVVDAATDKRLLRKIDRYILPIMCLVYGMYAWICDRTRCNRTQAYDT
jgi:ACS family allantoate permease-like MFS transporter